MCIRNAPPGLIDWWHSKSRVTSRSSHSRYTFSIVITDHLWPDHSVRKSGRVPFATAVKKRACMPAYIEWYIG